MKHPKQEQNVTDVRLCPLTPGSSSVGEGLQL